jgi:hypothetical protein
VGRKGPCEWEIDMESIVGTRKIKGIGKWNILRCAVKEGRDLDIVVRGEISRKKRGGQNYL